MKELRNGLLAQVGDRLRPLGFRPRKSYRDYYRDVGQARQFFQISFINLPSDFDVTANVAVRHHAVEDALNQKRSYLNEAEKKQTATVGAELGNIIGIGQHRWTVAVVDDIPFAADSIASYFERAGLPFLERFTSLEETFRVLRDDGKEAQLICPIPDKRARVAEVIRALIAYDAS